MGKEHIKIYPKILQPLTETLYLLEENKRIEYIDSLLIDVDQTIEKAQNYAQLEKVDYITALRQVITKERNNNEPIFDKRAGISHEAPIYSCDIELVNKIKVADQIFASKEYQKNIQLTDREDISERKFPPTPHRKLRYEELQDFENRDED